MGGGIEIAVRRLSKPVKHYVVFLCIMFYMPNTQREELEHEQWYILKLCAQLTKYVLVYWAKEFKLPF